MRAAVKKFIAQLDLRGVTLLGESMGAVLALATAADMPERVRDGEKDWSRTRDRQANKQLIPTAKFTQVPRAGHFVALERPDVPANLLR